MLGQIAYDCPQMHPDRKSRKRPNHSVTQNNRPSGVRTQPAAPNAKGRPDHRDGPSIVTERRGWSRAGRVKKA